MTTARNGVDERGIVVDVSRLNPVGTRPPLDTYIKQLWKLREFIGTQSRLRALSTGRGTALGRTWLVLSPFLQVLMYYVVFGLIIGSDRGVENFMAFLAVGILFFGPMGASLSGGMGAINAHKGLIRGFSFPRVSVIISETITGLVNAIPDMIALLIFIMVIPPHVTPHWTWVFIIPIVLFRQVFIAGMMMLTARLSVAIPDLNHLWPVLGRFWFYGSGVLFSVEHMVTHPLAKQIMSANPANVVLSMARTALIDHQIPHLSQWLLLIGWSALILVVGFVLFWRGEMEYSRADT